MFKRILIPLDTSPLAEKSLTDLSRFVDPAQTEVVLLYSWPQCQDHETLKIR